MPYGMHEYQCIKMYHYTTPNQNWKEEYNIDIYYGDNKCYLTDLYNLYKSYKYTL